MLDANLVIATDAYNQYWLELFRPIPIEFRSGIFTKFQQGFFERKWNVKHFATIEQKLFSKQ